MKSDEMQQIDGLGSVSCVLHLKRDWEIKIPPCFVGFDVDMKFSIG